jgi:hypothetical protein
MRFVPVLIEMVRANQIGIGQGAGLKTNVGALEALSGESFGADWPAWVEWYGATDLSPPPGFIGWKGRLLGRLDPGFQAFLRDGVAARIRVEEIVWGGVAVDGIPALDHPATLLAQDVDYLLPHEPVFGLVLGGEARAYPLRILDWHELVNDELGGVPVSLAYCTLCGAGIAWDGRASDDRTYTFGSSGLLFRSNKLMYDRQTNSLWNQFTGEPAVGSLANTDVRLSPLPSVVTTWRDWATQHPDTTVLDIDTGYDREYEPGKPYGEYFASDRPLFPVWQRSDLLPPKERVFGLILDGEARAYPVKELAARIVTNDRAGATDVVLISARGTISVEAIDEPVEYDAGGEVRAYARGRRTFRPGSEPSGVVDGRGASWRITETALVGPNGERLPRLFGVQSYWFAWFQFYPRTSLFGSG